MDSKNILMYTKMATDGLAGIIKSVKEMPDTIEASDEEKQRMRDMLKQTDIDKAEQSIKQSLEKLANLAHGNFTK